jgi:predicted DCC family thiol-disulfide oxidoreductase YuxK
MRHLVLYDGVCGLCNRLNAFVLARDAAGVFAFASLQSKTGQAFLHQFGRSGQTLDTMCVVRDYRSSSPVLLTKSQAALFVIAHAGGGWRWLALSSVLPLRLRDAIYDLVSRNRYRVFGRYESCLLPTPQYKQRFIDESA